MKKYFSLLIFVILFTSSQTSTNAAENQTLDLKSEAVALLDSETGAVLYSKNPDERMFPASLTKIATAIYAIEKGDLNSIVTVSKNAVRQDGTRVYLNEGEQVPLKKLIQGMLINSGNDAAVAIAEHIDGSVDRFAENMNIYLKYTIGVDNTHFTNPNGLHDVNHYTTAMDLALITNYAIKNPVFAEIFGTKMLEWQGQSWSTTLFTHHRMLKGELPYQGVTGGKTGYTTESKQTLATTADNGKMKLTAIVLRSDLKNDKYKDTSLLFDYGFNGFQHATLKQGEIYSVDSKKYYPGKETLITESVDGSIKEVSNQGVLSIENKSGQIIQEVQLKYDEPKPDIVVVKKVHTKEKDQQLVYFNSIYGIMLIILVGFIIGARKKFGKSY